MGQASLLNGSFQKAVESFDRAIKINPEDASAWSDKGVALSRMGRYKMAELCFSYALGKDARNARLWLEDARAKELDGDFGQASKSYEQALALDASLAEAWLGKANSSLALGSYDEAMQSFKNASLYGLSTVGLAGQVKVLLAHSSALLQEGRSSEAYDRSNDALALDPQNIRALQLKGAATTRLGRFEAALACFDEILAGNPSDQQTKEGKSQALVGLGEKELARGNISQALYNYEEAYRLVPQSEETSSGWVKALTAEGDRFLTENLFSEAQKSYEGALILLPKDPGALTEKRGHRQHFPPRWMRPNLGNASRHNESKLFGYSHYLELAENYSRNGTYSLALESINKSLELDANRTEAWLLKGQMLSRLGRNSEALGSLDRALQINQSSLPALELKGASWP